MESDSLPVTCLRARRSPQEIAAGPQRSSSPDTPINSVTSTRGQRVEAVGRTLSEEFEPVSLMVPSGHARLSAHSQVESG